MTRAHKDDERASKRSCVSCTTVARLSSSTTTTTTTIDAAALLQNLCKSAIPRRTAREEKRRRRVTQTHGFRSIRLAKGWPRACRPAPARLNFNSGGDPGVLVSPATKARLVWPHAALSSGDGQITSGLEALLLQPTTTTTTTTTKGNPNEPDWRLHCGSSEGWIRAHIGARG